MIDRKLPLHLPFLRNIQTQAPKIQTVVLCQSKRNPLPVKRLFSLSFPVAKCPFPLSWSFDRKIDFIFLHDFYHQMQRTQRCNFQKIIFGSSYKNWLKWKLKLLFYVLRKSLLPDIFSLMDEDVLLIDLRSPDQNVQICFAQCSEQGTRSVESCSFPFWFYKGV